MSATDQWEAFMLDQDGFVMPDEHIRGWTEAKKLDVEARYDATDADPQEIVIVRGTARPVREHDALRQPGTYELWDCLIPPIDVTADEPLDVEALWDRALAITKAVNEAGVS